MATPIPYVIDDACSIAQSLATGAATVYSYSIRNKNNYTIYVKLYDKADANVNPLTDSPAQTITVAAKSPLNNPSVTFAFTNGIAIRCVTGSLQVDTNSPAIAPVIQLDLAQSAGGANLPITTNLIAGDGAGNGADSGIASANVLQSGGALGTPASGTLTNCTGLPVAGITASTSTALGVGSIELGNASDTTIARSGAGAITVEGVQVLLSGAALGTPASGTLTNCTLPSYNWLNNAKVGIDAPVGVPFMVSLTGYNLNSAAATVTDLFTVATGKTALLLNWSLTITAKSGTGTTAPVLNIKDHALVNTYTPNNTTIGANPNATSINYPAMTGTGGTMASATVISLNQVTQGAGATTLTGRIDLNVVYQP